MQNRVWLALLPLPLFAGGCGGGGSGGEAGPFEVERLSLPNGSVWEINRPIEIRFTKPVDFASVSSNTIQIRSEDGVPATGSFVLRDERTVVFQPNCPTMDDLSDAGLQPGGIAYLLRVVGHDGSRNTVLSIDGALVGTQQVRRFHTPPSFSPPMVFQDPVEGPPHPVFGSPDAAHPQVSHILVGEEHEVRFGADGRALEEVPLNLYSDASQRIVFLIAFDQPINPGSSNVSPARLWLEYQDHGDPSGETWERFETRVSLQENCTETGSLVRLEPVGLFPAASVVRAVVEAGFQDLVGEAVPERRSDFALAPTRPIAFPSLDPADRLSDAFQEEFDFGGDSARSFQDASALFDSPVAEWGEGRLSAAFSFEGTGGPNRDFDWHVRQGETFFFDTVHASINGGPDGIPTTTQEALDGIVDVRNLVIEAGGEIRVQGPNPMVINATGEVRILGRLDLSGFNAKDVATLDTGNQVEIGGTGAGGGGRGGNANENTSGPTPRGGRGQGPFRQAGLGGEGGEMSTARSGDKNARRPGGGGGGRFAKDVFGTTLFASAHGMQAGSGNPGNPGSTGAISGSSPALGGLPGQGPFVDASDANDFFGIEPMIVGGTLQGLIRGELPRLWAGYGGGGGGNAGRVYPNPNWDFKSDEKGGGGGGGAGGLHVKALGAIVFGAEGEILANGGRGGTGENTNFLDHIGGTGGGGSGGHVILESATRVDFTDGGRANAVLDRDIVLAAGPLKKIGDTQYVDACCRENSNGGAGGPGVIQIHVPNSRTPPSDDPSSDADILVPSIALTATDVLDQVTSPPAHVMIPTFGARSQVRSKWIPIAGADRRPDGTTGLVSFLFDGIEASGENAGKIRVEGSRVKDLDPLVSEADLVRSDAVRILTEPPFDGHALELLGAALGALRSGATNGISNDVYLRTPALLEGCSVRLQIGTTASHQDYAIARATYDEGAPETGDERLLLHVETAHGRLDDFNRGGVNGTTAFHLIPRFFQVVTGGLDDALPASAWVQLRFQATGANAAGAPDELDPVVDWTPDIATFNAQRPGAVRFFRFEVEFELDGAATGVGPDTVPVTLDFLKIPFVF